MVPSVVPDSLVNTAETSNKSATVPQQNNSNQATSTTPTSTPTDYTKQTSALSISSIKAKKELEKSFRPVEQNHDHLPALDFTELDLKFYWSKYAQRLSDEGFKIMEALLLINDPKVDGANITYELPNQGSKIDFDSEKGKLISYLRGHLQNHKININVIVNEQMAVRKAYTDQDRYNRLHEINPDIELLKNTFGLYF